MKKNLIKALKFGALGLFALAMVANLQTNISEVTFFDQAYAAETHPSTAADTGTDTDSGTRPKGKSCGKDECERQYGIPPYVRINKGHYYHCQTTDTGTCSDSNCFVDCDA